jgi:hypothetical protein
MADGPVRGIKGELVFSGRGTSEAYSDVSEVR